MASRLPVALGLSISVVLLSAQLTAAPPPRMRAKDAAKRARETSAATEDQTGYFFFAEELDPDWVPDDPEELRKKLKAFNNDYDAMLKDRLRLEGSIHLERGTLRDFCSAVARETRVGIYVDPKELEDVELSLDAKLTINVDGIRWKSILYLALDPLNLDWTIEDQILVIRQKQRIPPRPRIVREYAIGDIAWRYNNNAREFDPKGILSEIWLEVGSANIDYGAYGSNLQSGTYPVYSTSDQKKGTVLCRLKPQGHEALATGLAKFRALKRSLPDSDNIDFPQLLRILRWKEGFYPRERLSPEIVVLVVRSSGTSSEKERLSKDRPSVSEFGDRDTAMEYVRSLSAKQLRHGIVLWERDELLLGVDDPTNPPLQKVLEEFCRKRNIDLFEQVDGGDDKRYRRLVKSTRSIYPDEP